MEHSKLGWEDVIQFEEVKGYGKSIWKNEDKYFLVSEEGTVASWLAVYDLPQELFSLKFITSSKDLCEAYAKKAPLRSSGISQPLL